MLAQGRSAGGLARLASLKPSGLVIDVSSASACIETARGALQAMHDGRLDRPRTETTVTGCVRLHGVHSVGQLEEQVAAIRQELLSLREEHHGE